MNNIKIFTLILLLSLAQLSFSQQDSISLPPKPIGKSIPLLGITGVNDLFSDSTENEAANGGGLEMERWFSTQHYPNLRPCTNLVHKTFLEWGKSQKMVIAEDRLSETEILVELWQPDYNGYFELKYTSLKDGTYARASIDYYTITGELISIETIKNLYIKYKISNLWDEIQKSIGCGL